MKKNIVFLLALICFLQCILVTGCSDVTGSDESDKIKIVTTIFPIYDWTREITRNSDNVELQLLIDDGSDVHSFQASVDDIVNISSCDVLIYTGGESDSWIDDALKSKKNDDMAVINLMALLGDSLKEEDSHDKHECHDEHCDVTEYDEHIWLSLKNAVFLSREIADAISYVDTNNSDLYRENFEAYVEKLKKIDEDFDQFLLSADNKNLVFCDRFPFRYFASDYNLTCFSAFSGCSTDSKASFDVIISLANRIDEFQLKSVICLVGGERKIADTVISNTKDKNQKILYLNSMQNISLSDIKGGMSYLSVMESNIEVFKNALS